MKYLTLLTWCLVTSPLMSSNITVESVILNSEYYYNHDEGLEILDLRKRKTKVLEAEFSPYSKEIPLLPISFYILYKHNGKIYIGAVVYSERLVRPIAEFKEDDKLKRILNLGKQELNNVRWDKSDWKKIESQELDKFILNIKEQHKQQQ